MRNAPLSPESPGHASRGRLRAVNGSIAKSLRRFADYGELKKAALMVTAFQLDRTEIRQLKVRMCLFVVVVVVLCHGDRSPVLVRYDVGAVVSMFGGDLAVLVHGC